jgi:hypothetical protein
MAAAALTGGVLIGGLHGYHEVLEVIKLQHEVHEQLHHIDENTGQVFDTDRRLFQESLSTPNIRQVLVNRMPIALDATTAHRKRAEGAG